MKRVFSALLAGAATVVLMGSAFAADPDPGRQGAGPQQPTPDRVLPRIPEDTGTFRDGEQSGAEVTPRERQYLSSLKKCEPLHGAQKQECIDAARRRAGEL